MSIKTWAQRWKAEWRGDGKWYMLFLAALAVVNCAVLLHLYLRAQ